jgi:arsenate reductase (thioredoxin)
MQRWGQGTPSRLLRTPMTATQPTRILFVCVENSSYSQMAEAFARIHGGKKVEAYSAGSKPSRTVNHDAVAAMSEKGYDLAEHQPKSLDAVPDVEYDVLVTINCDDTCGTAKAKRREDWQVPNPQKKMSPDEFRVMRYLIERKVIHLLESL